MFFLISLQSVCAKLHSHHYPRHRNSRQKLDEITLCAFYSTQTNNFGTNQNLPFE